MFGLLWQHRIPYSSISNFTVLRSRGKIRFQEISCKCKPKSKQKCSHAHNENHVSPLCILWVKTRKYCEIYGLIQFSWDVDDWRGDSQMVCSTWSANCDSLTTSSSTQSFVESSDFPTLNPFTLCVSDHYTVNKAFPKDFAVAGLPASCFCDHPSTEHLFFLITLSLIRKAMHSTPASTVGVPL